MKYTAEQKEILKISGADGFGTQKKNKPIKDGVEVNYKSIQKKALEITKLLIDSELSMNDQLQVIYNVREKLQFCKIKGLEIEQTKLKI